MIILPSFSGIIQGEILALDLIQESVTAAYSVSRKLRSGYTGNAFRVRRSSDNTEQDIGFNGNIVNTSALLSFVGAGNGFIRTVYDQKSGTANNFIQTTQSRQPQIVSSGSLITLNNQPCMEFNPANSTFLGNSSSTFNLGSVICVMKPTSTVDNTTTYQVLFGTQFGQVGLLILGSVDTGLTNEVITLGRSTSLNSAASSSSLASINTNSHVISGFMAGTSSEIYLDNSANLKNIDEGTGAAALSAFTGSMGWGCDSTDTLTNFFSGRSSELILLQNSVPSKWPALRGNINNFYKLY